MTDTVRLQCLKALQARLREMQAGQDYLLNFNQVELGPIDGGEASRKRAVVGIVPGKEVKDVQFPMTYCQLPIAVEFRLTWNPGDAPSQELAEIVLGDIVRKVLEDQSLGGLAVDLKDAGNEIILSIYSDKSIVGVVYFDLLYRHNTMDPRQAI
jgi:hypothetical protein